MSTVYFFFPVQVLQYRSEYLLKIPVEIVTDTVFLLVFTEEYSRPELRKFLIEILKIVIVYSSRGQKQFMNKWFSREISTNEVLQNVLSKKCTNSGCVSSLCFLEKMFGMIVSCEENYLKIMVLR